MPSDWLFTAEGLAATLELVPGGPQGMSETSRADFISHQLGGLQRSPPHIQDPTYAQYAAKYSRIPSMESPPMEYPRYGIGLGDLPTREAGIFQNPRYLIRNRDARQSPRQNIPYHRLSPEATNGSWLTSTISDHKCILTALTMPERHPTGHPSARRATKRTDNCHQKAE
ncbi:hypothetical protein K523DRAFT_41139 [Schizophyllum commune Tattone D]|nr:hypothetical protein K523DRAFT_41139 [Schizophyllum commune Tattone D]